MKPSAHGQDCAVNVGCPYCKYAAGRAKHADHAAKDFNYVLEIINGAWLSSDFSIVTTSRLAIRRIIRARLSYPLRSIKPLKRKR